jgi:hypothetical protein
LAKFENSRDKAGIKVKRDSLFTSYLPCSCVIYARIAAMLSAETEKTCKGDFMELQDVNSEEQFEVYYKSHALLTTDDKISSLKKAMKVRAILCEGNETPEETLRGLEESALLGLWKAS